MPLILLIEDHQIIRDNTAQLLELAGYAVQTAENGELGVQLALATRPDLVICDIMMPVLDGYGVLQIFNQHPQLLGVPFIFLTAKTEQADRRRGMALGADDYLSKPFDKADLLSAVSGRLSRFQQLKPEPSLSGEQLNKFLDEAQQVGDLASLSRDRKAHLLRKKQDIYLEGDESTRLYFVQSGRVKTVKTTAGGKELIVGLHGPGEFFGYLPLLQNTPHRDSAIAVDESELLYIPKEDFTALLLRNPDVGQQFVRLLAGQVSGQAELLLAMAYNSIRRRVADTLVQLHEQAGEANNSAIQLTRDDMAAMVGTAPESLSRTLNEFKHDGFIELTPNTIRVLEPEKLRRARW
ncbi:response regulator [Hymenobacter arizonensis]|uniref:cAMP-binding domain of CRP or a regulatory subunit of cAMP-dependent protein kinases n=1 Tax=Hymenobacter arizonensis TaxID=1227077 RepID=A0A1I5UI39_HYMAR|nr:response regulator [Hymenobacter arizonensis]SFP94953.1 cAMP-binding domain of CRP or a regulatory subunit of cAMP-dependent protein kinases [Hymenobacter arizonensis]